MLIIQTVVLCAYACGRQNNDEIRLLAKQLGWIKELNIYNLCDGYYKELPIPYTPNPLAVSQAGNYDITADHVTLALKGMSTLKGHVRITQPDVEMQSDVAYLYHEKKTGEISKVDAFGNVRLIQPVQLLLAKQGSVDVKKKTITVKNVIYRSVLAKNKTVVVKNPKTGKTEKHLYQLNARGTAKEVDRIKPGIINLKSASYTTCPPGSNVWKIKAGRIQLNNKTGSGYATNMWLLIKNIPIFYFPYISFPINNKRKSGFLYPAISASSRTGASIAIPYYWNMAPNYDMTITLTIMAKRGVFWNDLFRYLTPSGRNKGSFNVSFIPSDSEFRQFQKDSMKEWVTRPTFNELQNASDNRNAFSWQNQTQFNLHWAGNINFNYVSDDYFIKDFGNNLLDISNNQLLRQAKVTYSGEHWTFLGNLQGYQTLHPVDQANVLNQYARVPQFQLNAIYPNEPYGFSYSLNSEFVQFSKSQEHGSSIKPVTGSRISVRPAASLPLIWPFAYLTPRVQLQMTSYRSHNIANKHENIAIPIVDVKSGLYFDRAVNIFHHKYQQTLEPVIYYLYIPYRDQDDFPIYDTAYQSFSYNFMFQNNRFSGIDRIGDTNQATLGVTTRFIDSSSGDQKASASIGEIFYLHRRKVKLCEPGSVCALSDSDKQNRSPIAADVTYNFNPHWSANAGLTWNTYLTNFNNQNISVQYKPDQSHVVNFGYDYVHGGDILTGTPKESPKNNLQQTNISAYWKLNKRWNLMGRWNYNWSHGHAQTFFYGIDYESCCWAVRLIGARTFTGLGVDNQNKFDNTYYIQFLLKGLGNIGSGDPGGFLSQSINGYVDQFGGVT